LSGVIRRKLTSPNAQVNGWFGSSVDVAESTGIVVVAAFAERGAGRVYLFRDKTGKLIRKLTSPNSQPGGGFGGSVSTSGATVVVGASCETAAGLLEAGRAYVFS
jgi:hypothetical protein